MISIKKPSRYIIDIWEKDNQWYQEYIELFPHTEENIKAISLTIPLLNKLLTDTFVKYKIEEIEMYEMIGIKLITISKTLVPIANQLLSEFLLISDLGEIKLSDIFLLAINSLLSKEKNDVKILHGKT